MNGGGGAKIICPGGDFKNDKNLKSVGLNSPGQVLKIGVCSWTNLRGDNFWKNNCEIHVLASK